MIFKTLYINAKVWQEDGTFQEAFGVKGNLFNLVGSNSDASRIQNNYNKVVDLEGRLVLPGLTDGHVHLVQGSLFRKRIDCSSVKSFDDLKEKIYSYIKENQNKKWLLGGNLDIQSLLTSTNLQHNILDSIINDRPLFITNYDYHSAYCNTIALEKTGILSKLSEFNDNEVVKDINGKPTGIVKEKAMNYVMDKIPGSTNEEKVKATEDMVKTLSSYGITSISDITLIEDLEAYETLFEQNKLKLRINSYIPFESFNNFPECTERMKALDPEKFSIKGFKAYYDGALGSETALFKENYKGKSHNGYKTELAESGELYELAKKIDQLGKQIIIHAIGDKAVSEVLDISEKLINDNGAKDRRVRIEHAQHIDESDFNRFRKMDVIASVQPAHLKYDAKKVKEKLPEAIVKRTHNYKQLIDREATVAFGTDFPIVDINPFENIKTALTRKIEDEVFFPEHRIDLHNCIMAYTINNAYATFDDIKRGSIEEDKLADFVIMEDDIFEIEEEEISQAKVWRTYLNGEEIYCNDNI